MNKYLYLLAATIDKNPCSEFGIDSDLCLDSSDTSNANTEVLSLIYSITNWLTIAIGIAAVVFIIISGIQLISSSGNADKVKRARRTLLYSVIGLVVAILANVIVRIVFDFSDIVNPVVVEETS